ncbi:GlxA family transcriptional regulator [Tianweitania sp.]|uniref:GlxA family transcriptional regulator n=1 Tax=Tianweitania sp. TaxID=2021634 RepID=UPI0028981AD7|nr:GlxA family transcriptional regulator [Tianweitania sp.]
MTIRFAFILIHEFTLSPFSLFVDTLRLAGDEADRSRRIAFDWQVLGTRGLPIRSSCGLEILPTAELSHAGNFDFVVLVGGLLGKAKSLGREQIAFLQQAAGAKKPIIGLCTATFALAEHGFLDGYKACVSWLHLADFQSAYPAVQAIADRLFLIDRGRTTCAGGAGAADLAASLVAKTLGEREAEKAAEILLLDRIRTHRDLQPSKNLFGEVSNFKVRQALLLMQNHCLEPLAVSEIASRTNCSPRQLERLFSANLSISPGHAYMTLRIERAKSLLRKTELPISEIAYQCGFVNAGHFARAFREHTGSSPSKFKLSGRA